MSISSFGRMAMWVCTQVIGQMKWGRLLTIAEISVIYSVFMFLSWGRKLERPTTMNDFSSSRQVSKVRSWPAGSWVSSSENRSGECHICAYFCNSLVLRGNE